MKRISTHFRNPRTHKSTFYSYLYDINNNIALFIVYTSLENVYKLRAISTVNTFQEWPIDELVLKKKKK